MAVKEMRPTSGKVMLALFNILGNIHGKGFLDLFAGSGRVAASARLKGASPVVLVESDRRRHAAAQKMLTEDAPMFAGLFDANPYSQEAVRQYSKLLNIASAGDIDLLCNRAVHWWPDASLPEHAREEK